jgi:hypothetical protein
VISPGGRPPGTPDVRRCAPHGRVRQRFSRAMRRDENPSAPHETMGGRWFAAIFMIVGRLRRMDLSGSKPAFAAVAGPVPCGPPAVRGRDRGSPAGEHPADRGLTAIKQDKPTTVTGLFRDCGSKVAISAPGDPRSRKQTARGTRKPGHNGRTGRPSRARRPDDPRSQCQRHARAPGPARRKAKPRNEPPAAPRHAPDAQLETDGPYFAANDPRHSDATGRLPLIGLPRRPEQCCPAREALLKRLDRLPGPGVAGRGLETSASALARAALLRRGAGRRGCDRACSAYRSGLSVRRLARGSAPPPRVHALERHVRSQRGTPQRGQPRPFAGFGRRRA